MCLTLPIAVALTACPSDDGSGSGADENDSDTGIGSLGTESSSGDTTAGDTTADDTTTLDEDTTADGTAEEESSTTSDPNCGEVSIVPTYVPPQVMLVVDASGSMVNNSWDHDLDPNTPQVTRWNTLHGVVSTVMDNFGPAMYAGIQRFPSEEACPDATPMSSNCYNSGSCIVGTQPEVGVSLDNGASVIAAIPGPTAGNTEIVGGTPATKGMNSAVSHLEQQPEAFPRYVLLITDGAANCDQALSFPDYIEQYDETLPTTVQAAFDGGITTFVVGIDIEDMLQGVGTDGSPEANPFERLNDVAIAGGAPKNEGMDLEKFYNTTNQQELLDAIQAILGEVTDCTIDLTMTDEGPPDESQIPYVTFTANEELVPFLEDPADCDTMDGWTWIEEGLIMTFCGQYCEDFKNGMVSFDGEYGCPPAG
ncbi:vWA domain-containing protein [Plesiocystis pacifica]|nr:VWA domain-containing protein [Plesiocystis pacifica]